MKATRHEANKDDRNPNAVGDFFFINLQFSFVKRLPKKGRKKEKNVDKYGPMNPQRKADAELAIKSNPNFASTFQNPCRTECECRARGAYSIDDIADLARGQALRIDHAAQVADGVAGHARRHHRTGAATVGHRRYQPVQGVTGLLHLHAVRAGDLLGRLRLPTCGIVSQRRGVAGHASRGLHHTVQRADSLCLRLFWPSLLLHFKPHIFLIHLRRHDFDLKKHLQLAFFFPRKKPTLKNNMQSDGKYFPG